MKDATSAARETNPPAPEEAAGADALFLRFQSGFGRIAALRVAGILALFALTVLVGRSLGPAGQGVYAIALVATGLAVQLGNFGLHAANTYFAAGEPQRAAQLATHTLLWALPVGAVLTVLLTALIYFYPGFWGRIDPGHARVFSLAVPFLLLSLLCQGVLLGLHRTGAYYGIEVLGRLTLLGAAAIGLLGLRMGEAEFLKLWTAAQILTGIAYGFYVGNVAGRLSGQVDPGLLQASLRYGLKAYLALLFSFLVLRSDILLVNYFLGTGAGGVYSVAALLSEQMLLLPALLGTALFPLVSQDQIRGPQLTLRVMRSAAPVLLVVCAAGALLARPLVLFFYGWAFEPAATAFLWLLPGVFLLSLEVVLAHHLAGTGYPRQLVRYWGTAFALNFLANLYMIPRWGIVGAAITSSLTYALVFVLVLRLFQTQSRASLRELFWPRWAEARELLGVAGRSDSKTLK